jgi:hypothetical protein
MAVSTLQVANPSMGTVTRAPQTTAATPAAAGVPFARLSRQMQIQGPQQAGQQYGTLWTPTLKPVGGYLRNLRFTITSLVNATTPDVFSLANPDAPYNVIQNVFFRDPFGQPMIQADGYSLYLINLYSGQSGALAFGNYTPGNPSTAQFSSAQLSTGFGTGNIPSIVSNQMNTNGAFSFAFDLPLELDSSGYCSLPDMNASSQPQLQVQINPLSTVFGTLASGTNAPLLNLQIDEPFWGAPVDNPQAAPADVGSSAQWSVVRAAAAINGGAYNRIQLPRVGTYIHTLILQLRDANNNRVDAWPVGDLSIWFDGVPLKMETLAERSDAMWKQFGVPRPAGVLVYSFRDSIQSFVSSGDTYDLLAPTTPATLLEIAGTFLNTNGAAGGAVLGPLTILTTVGELFPLGGIPYTHLAM